MTCCLFLIWQPKEQQMAQNELSPLINLRYSWLRPFSPSLPPDLSIRTAVRSLHISSSKGSAQSSWCFTPAKDWVGHTQNISNQSGMHNLYQFVASNASLQCNPVIPTLEVLCFHHAFAVGFPGVQHVFIGRLTMLSIPYATSLQVKGRPQKTPSFTSKLMFSWELHPDKNQIIRYAR